MVEFNEDVDAIAVAINTDLPVAVSFVGQPIEEISTTPFMALVAEMANDVVVDVLKRVESLRDLRERLFPHIRRAASYFTRDDLDGACNALRNAPGGNVVDFSTHDVAIVLGNAMSIIYAPIEGESLRHETADEWSNIIGEALGRDKPAVKRLFTEFSEPLSEHRARAFDTALNMLEAVDALIPALFAERMSESADVDIEQYRVMRDDFDALKVRYQDAFELASRTLAFTSRVANIACRGDVRDHADGLRYSFNKALNHTRANKRESWLADFPAATKLYNAMKRNTRNGIGHRLVRYDFETGTLKYDDGKTENYLLFLVDYLHAVRLTHYVLDVCELLWRANVVVAPN